MISIETSRYLPFYNSRGAEEGDREPGGLPLASRDHSNGGRGIWRR